MYTNFSQTLKPPIINGGFGIIKNCFILKITQDIKNNNYIFALFKKKTKDKKHAQKEQKNNFELLKDATELITKGEYQIIENKLFVISQEDFYEIYDPEQYIRISQIPFKYSMQFLDQLSYNLKLKIPNISVVQIKKLNRKWNSTVIYSSEALLEKDIASLKIEPSLQQALKNEIERELNAKKVNSLRLISELDVLVSSLKNQIVQKWEIYGNYVNKQFLWEYLKNKQMDITQPFYRLQTLLNNPKKDNVNDVIDYFKNYDSKYQENNLEWVRVKWNNLTALEKNKVYREFLEN
ncbi:hypothetical protein V2E24_02570 [Mycoplasmopsis ciconiae]|uniref:Uncharacterized protein n=1 Tax=Mycoplasmopsis ciconiae TaxID=561067 RepID=A0ABU7MLP7_9BACT|nr:hypothetical protein [Mycoplasmopsis ciconiae]